MLWSNIVLIEKMLHTGNTLGILLLGIGLLTDDLPAEPLRYQLSTRLEGHMLPAVSTGPMDPSWSPNEEWIAFSMRGDIWKVPVGGGEAVALTKGPAYHFEPSWSPDGKFIALSIDLNGNLDIGIISAEGGTPKRLTTHRQVDVQPAWTPDSQALFFTTARHGNLDIYRLDLTNYSETPVIVAPGHQIHPAVSPDGNRLAYISPVPGRLGPGGIWVKELASGNNQLSHYEETNYRSQPSWTPDGQSLIYVSDAAGSNDLTIVPSLGGSTVRLTFDPMDEFAPSVSLQGSIAFVSNRNGPTELLTLPTSGGSLVAWDQVPIVSRKPLFPTGHLQVRIVDSRGRTTPSRVQLVASDGRSYSPEGSFHRVSSLNETHYFHTRGTIDLELPAGPTTIEVFKGFEYIPASTQITIPAGSNIQITLQLNRLVDPATQGWYSGDTHIHDLHEGRFGLTSEDLFYQLQAEDLHVTNSLIHMDGTKLMGRWEDLTGKIHPLSNSEYILYYSQEFRGGFGHVGLLGLKRFIMPLIAGVPNSPYWADDLNAHYIQQSHEQGGLGGFLHPYNSSIFEPKDASGSEIPVDVALGFGDFYDIVSMASDEFASSKIYGKLLNCGFRLAATGGSDNFSNVWRDPPPGSARTYARIDGPLSFHSWLRAIQANRTFGTNGPLLFLSVKGKTPGDTLRLNGTEKYILPVEIQVSSLSPLEKVELLMNGKVIHRTSAPPKEKKVYGKYFYFGQRKQLDCSASCGSRTPNSGRPLRVRTD